MSRFTDQATKRIAFEQALGCPYCGGRFSPSLGRVWHKGHPRDCSRKASLDRQRQDAEAAALRADGGMTSQECGCRGAEHLSTTCTRWFELFPDAEPIDRTGGFDG